jgi:acyl carrier protein
MIADHAAGCPDGVEADCPNGAVADSFRDPMHGTFWRTARLGTWMVTPWSRGCIAEAFACAERRASAPGNSRPATRPTLPRSYPKRENEDPMPQADLKEELRSLIAEIAEIDRIPDEADFKELGIDSMMGVEIVAAIERHYHVKFEDSELSEVSTLNRSYDLVLGKLGQTLAAAG